MSDALETLINASALLVAHDKINFALERLEKMQKYGKDMQSSRDLCKADTLELLKKAIYIIENSH